MDLNILRKRYLTVRFRAVVFNLFNNMLVPFFNILLSVLVVRLFSLTFWGEYSKFILLTALLTQLSLWGSKDYLLTLFSRNPASISANWQSSMAARNIITLLAAIFIFLLIPAPASFFLAGILTVRSFYLSYDPVITYSRQFAAKTAAELAGNFFLLGLLVLFRNQLNIQSLLLFTLAAELVKLMIMLQVFYKPYPLNFTLRFHKKHLNAALGFVLLSFSGFLIYKSDQIFAAFFLPAETYGSYQLLMSFLLVIHALSGFIIQPFLPSMYRCRLGTVKKISQQLLFHGTWISLAGIVAIRIILNLLYHVNISTPACVAALFFLIPPFYYAPLLYYCLALNKQMKVVVIHLAGAGCTFLLCILQQRWMSDPLLMVVSAAALSQWMVLVAFANVHKKSA